MECVEIRGQHSALFEYLLVHHVPQASRPESFLVLCSPVSHPMLLSEQWVYRHTAYMGSEDPNSDPHASVAIDFKY